MAENTEAWECCVCLTDCSSEARITLACKHPLCLCCYEGMVEHKNGMWCPLCRQKIRKSHDEPASTASLKEQITQCVRLQNQIAATEKQLATIHAALVANRQKMLSEKTDEINTLSDRISLCIQDHGKQKTVEQNLQTLRGVFNTNFQALKNKAEESGSWESVQRIYNKYVHFVSAE